MPKHLILVRHGKAQSRNLELADFDRELTGAGKRALKAWLPKSRRLLMAENVGSIELWASPAARTMQTAQVVADVWGKHLDGMPGRPDPVVAFWSGSIAQMFATIEGCSADTLVVCGHNPSIEVMCSFLTGSSITFATGGVAALRLDGGVRSETARLLWFIQGPESRNWKH